MRVGIIGCGQIVEAGHVPALIASPEIETVAVADVSQRRAEIVADALRARGRPSVYTDHSRMLEGEELALVLIATPPAAHRQLALDVASSGRHVLCEKPIATTLADGEAIVQACDQARVRCLMVHNYLAFDEFLRVRELICAGAVGRPRTVILEGLGSYPWDGVPEFRPGWRYMSSVAGGGRLMDTGVHCLYLAEMFFGRRPLCVSADASFHVGGPPTDVRCFARYHFGEAIALVHIGEGQGGPRVEVIGEQGRIQLEYADDTSGFDSPPVALKLYRDGALLASEPVAPRRHLVTKSFYDHVLARLAQPEGYSHSGRHGRDLLATIMATYRSARESAGIDLSREISPVLRDGGALALWAPDLS